MTTVNDDFCRRMEPGTGQSGVAKEDHMPALASLEDLKEVDAKVREFRETHPEAYRAISEVLKKYRRIGYKNIIKLLLEEATPEKLKGEAG